MPIYCYYCSDCGYEEEVLRLAVTEVEYVKCVNCGTPMDRKFPTNVMFIWKGEGGYPSRRKQIFNTTTRIHPKLE